MKKIKVISNQSLFDIAVQVLGNVDATFDLAYANGLSVTALLSPGQELKIPESLFENPGVLDYFDRRHKKVATYMAPVGDLLPVPEGIGYMIIEDTFIVS